MDHTYMSLQNVLVEEKDSEMVLARVVFRGLQIVVFTFYVVWRATLVA
jgi:hypothetical protein